MVDFVLKGEILKRSRTGKAVSSALGVVVDKKLAHPESFMKFLRVVRARFDFEVSVFFADPDFVFGEPAVLDCLTEGVIDRLGITGSPSSVYFDSHEFFKRIDCDEIFIIQADLLHAKEWISLLQFRVSLNDAVYECQQSFCERILAAKQEHLRSKDSKYVASYADYLVSLRSGQDMSVAMGECIDSHFVSAQGLVRFGGVERFSVLPIVVGDTPLHEIPKFWSFRSDFGVSSIKQVDQTFESRGQCKVVHELPSSILLSDGSHFVFDVNPISTPSVSSSAHQVPRTIVSGRKISGVSFKHVDTTVVFAMSNFNKAPYLTAALYSIAMQTHPKVVVKLIDDGSDDDSLEVVQKFDEEIIADPSFITASKNRKGLGTYWIRNKILSESIAVNDCYVVNDSDDYSALHRVAIQLSLLSQSGNCSPKICFGDIVRVDAGFRILPLDNKVERYGTASLGCFSAQHRTLGFYETLKKNADTEFIERVKHFFGKESVKWFRYPILFQPFDGGNLTSDIYRLNSKTGEISQALSNRGVHVELFRARHKKAAVDTLALEYDFPRSTIPAEYGKKIPDFIVPGYSSRDVVVFVTGDSNFEQVRRVAKYGDHFLVPASSGFSLYNYSGSKVFSTDISSFFPLESYLAEGGSCGYLFALPMLNEPEVLDIFERKASENIESIASGRYTYADLLPDYPLGRLIKI